MKSILSILIGLTSTEVMAKVVEVRSNSDGDSSTFNVRNSGSIIINKKSDLQLVSVTGLDTRLETTIYNSQNEVLGTYSSDFVSINDKIALSNTSNISYGKVIPVGHLGDGSYRVTQSSFDLTGNLVETSELNLIVDTVDPTISGMLWRSAFYNFDNVPNGQWLGDFEVSRFGVNGVGDDGSGIDNVQVYATELGSNTPVGKTITLSYDPASKTAYSTLNMALFAGYEKTYQVHFIATDKAGNKKHFVRQIQMTGNGVKPEPVGVWDGTYSGNFLPGSPYSGYKAYKAGMQVNNYAIRVVYRVPQYWTNTSNPGRFLAPQEHHGYGVAFNPREYVAGGYSYFSVPTYFSKGDQRIHERPIARHDRWVAHFLYQDLNLAPHLGQQPKIKKQEIYLPDKGWVGHLLITRNIATNNQRPAAIRVFVEPRTFAQRLWLQDEGYSDCYIPAGGTSCQVDISNNRYADWGTRSSDLPKGKLFTNHYWMNKVVKDDFRELKSPNAGGINIHIDLTPPVLSSAYKVPYEDNFFVSGVKTYPGELYNQTDFSQVGVRLTNLDSGEVSNLVKDGSAGSLWLNDKVVPRAAGGMSEKISYSSIKDGRYHAVAFVKDTFDNTVQSDIGTINIDHDAPEVSFLNSNGLLLAGMTISGLDKVNIKVTDKSTFIVKKAILSGGQANEYVELNSYFDGTNYKVEKPKIFPNLNDDEFYTLTVSVIDIHGNEQSYSVKFKYYPENVIELGVISSLTSDEPLYDSQDHPIAKIVFKPLTTEGGQVATGPQDYLVTLRKDAAFSVYVDGTEVLPGSTRQFIVDLGDGQENVIIPIVTKHLQEGNGMVMVEIPRLKSKYE